MISINDLRLLSTQITEKSLLCPSRISSICPPTLRQICPWVCTILCLCHLHNMSKRAHNRNLLYLSSNSPTKLGTWFLCSCHQQELWRTLGHFSEEIQLLACIWHDIFQPYLPNHRFVPYCKSNHCRAKHYLLQQKQPTNGQSSESQITIVHSLR